MRVERSRHMDRHSGQLFVGYLQRYEATVLPYYTKVVMVENMGFLVFTKRFLHS